MDLRPRSTSIQHRRWDDHADDGNHLMYRLYGEAARMHNLIGALAYRRSTSNQATTHYRSAFQFLLQQEEEELANSEYSKPGNRHREEPSGMQAYIRSITQEYQAERNDITIENPPLPVYYTTASSRLQNSPYFMDEHGDCFVLDGNLSARQVADRPPTAEDIDCMSSAIVMFNLSLCHYKIGRYEQSLELLNLASQCLTGSEGAPWAMVLGSAIMDNMVFISEVCYIEAVVPFDIARLYHAHAPAA